MSRKAFIFGLCVIAVLIFSLYRAKYGARESAAALQEVEQRLAEEEARRQELLTEFSHRARQEWLEVYARRELGMGPARADQYVRLEQLGERIGPRIEPAQEGTDGAE
jgi:hypothetical protein